MSDTALANFVLILLFIMYAVCISAFIWFIGNTAKFAYRVGKFGDDYPGDKGDRT